MFRRLILLTLMFGVLVSPGQWGTTAQAILESRWRPSTPRHPESTTVPNNHSGDYQLVWQEEFSGEQLDEETFFYYKSCHYYKEIECTTKRRTENVRIENGNLVIEARPERWNNRKFTSARLSVLKSWKYGLFKVRARLPRGKDLCPAIWLWPPELHYGENGESGQMRFLRYDGGTPDRVAWNMRFGGDWRHIVEWSEGKTFDHSDFSEEFHTFALEWTATEMAFSVDEQTYFERSIDENLWGGHGKNPYFANGQPFDRLFSMAFSLSIGNEYCGRASVTPRQARDWEKPTFEIDWIRVFQK